MDDEDRKKIVREVMEAPLYAVVLPTDQTIMFLTKDGDETVRHPEAGLWDDMESASSYASSRGLEPDEYDVMEVRDEDEFRRLEDTW